MNPTVVLQIIQIIATAEPALLDAITAIIKARQGQMLDQTHHAAIGAALANAVRPV